MQIKQVSKKDLINIITVFLREAGLFIAAVFILYFDGTSVGFKEYNLQFILNVIMIIAFVAMVYRATPKVKELMFYGVILGFLGEYFFSVYLNMYTYRLSNVPLYVPFGHGVLYARVLRFSKASVVKKNHKTVEQFFSVLISLLAITYLVFFNDIFGFVMTGLVFLILWKRPKDRLFFFSMYFLVAILEIGGTAFGCWKWPDTAFGVIDFLPSNNPPSGISLFYFLLDVGCFVLYTQRHKIAWKRLKNIRKIQM